MTMKTFVCLVAIDEENFGFWHRCRKSESLRVRTTDKETSGRRFEQVHCVWYREIELKN